MCHLNHFDTLVHENPAFGYSMKIGFSIWVGTAAPCFIPLLRCLSSSDEARRPSVDEEAVDV